MKVIKLVFAGLPMTGAVLASHNGVAGSYPRHGGGILQDVFASANAERAIHPKMATGMDAIPIVLDAKHESDVSNTMQSYSTFFCLL